MTAFVTVTGARAGDTASPPCWWLLGRRAQEVALPSRCGAVLVRTPGQVPVFGAGMENKALRVFTGVGHPWVTDRGGREGEFGIGASLTTLMHPGGGLTPSA